MIYTLQEDYSCPICGKKLKNGLEVIEHVKEHEYRVNAIFNFESFSQMKCPFCSSKMRFKIFSTRVKKIRYKTKVRVFGCCICHRCKAVFFFEYRLDVNGNVITRKELF